MFENVEVEKYITCEITFRFYEDLTTGQLKGLANPAVVFPAYYEAYATVFSYRNSPMLALNALKTRLDKQYEDVDRYLIYKILVTKLRNDIREIFVLKSEGLKLCASLIEKELDSIFPPTEEETEEEETFVFSWRDTKAHLQTLPNDNERIAYLIDQMALYQQEIIANGKPTDGYFEKCKVERERIEQQQELQKIQSFYGSNLYLSRQRGKKIDFIRIINAMYELRFFRDSEEKIPTKESVMRNFGKVLGIDLSGYDSDLSQAFNSGAVETNISIFDEMKKITTSQITQKLIS
nr:hypothetical protein [uncultured Chitinophaga sp.]